MRKLALLCLLSLVSAITARATIFSQLHGVVHDPQHRPIANARIELHAANSAFTRSSTTAQDGSFTIPSLPSATTPSPSRNPASTPQSNPSR
ncbi:carboxypeptidase-like regulatory domain-containing protein [Tunturiibacter empetritectus]|uniref:carboxypeptidase-like regulatory domain-containing protein n=1 Tax=Tunturiibacter empetritectus TaxID=3069691 RepID=UPI003D9B28E4